MTDSSRTRRPPSARLRQLLLASPRTEKTRHVLKDAGLDHPDHDGAPAGTRPSRERSYPGHRRHGADAYVGASRVHMVYGRSDGSSQSVRRPSPRAARYPSTFTS